MDTSAQAAGQQAGLVTAWDISASARKLALVKLAYFCLIDFGLLTAAAFIVQTLLAPILGTPGLSFSLVSAAFLALGACGVYALYVYPNLVSRTRYKFDLAVIAIGAVLTTYICTTLGSAGSKLDNEIRMARLFGNSVPANVQDIAESAIRTSVLYFYASIALGVGLIALLLLWRARVGRDGLYLLTITQRSHDQRTLHKPTHIGGKAIDSRRAMRYLALALAVFVVSNIILPLLPGFLSILGTLLSLGASVLAVIYILRARQFLQMSADSFLHDDAREPILYLRSFVDDTPVTANAGVGPFALDKLIDFSLETRFARYFMDFGPFIAVGSPRDIMPQLGAPRVKLADNEWHVFVERMIGHSQLVVMLAGLTDWLTWEMKKVLDGGHAFKLLLVFPRPANTPPLAKGKARKKMQTNLLERFAHTQAAFAGSKWEAALAAIPEPGRVLALRCKPDGSLTVITSKIRTKDAYDLAVEMLHLDMGDNLRK